MIKNVLSAPILYALFSLTACSAFDSLKESSQIDNRDDLRSALDGRGTVTLDASNPYIAPNALLAEESKHSEILKGFLSIKGNPNSLMFSDSFFGGATLILNYEDKGESYTLKESGKNWVISAPLKTEIKKDASTNQSSSLYKDEPPIVTYLDPTLENAKNNALKKEPKPIEQAPKNDINEEIKSDDSTAKDIYHSVKSSKETIEFITLWYTESHEDIERICRINNLKAFQTLKEGQSVRIPAYLVRKTETPTEADLENFLIKKN